MCNACGELFLWNFQQDWHRMWWLLSYQVTGTLPYRLQCRSTFFVTGCAVNSSGCCWCWRFVLKQVHSYWHNVTLIYQLWRVILGQLQIQACAPIYSCMLILGASDRQQSSEQTNSNPLATILLFTVTLLFLPVDFQFKSLRFFIWAHKLTAPLWMREKFISLWSLRAKIMFHIIRDHNFGDQI